jgi:hypothetical protein
LDGFRLNADGIAILHLRFIQPFETALAPDAPLYYEAAIALTLIVTKDNAMMHPRSQIVPSNP